MPQEEEVSEELVAHHPEASAVIEEAAEAVASAATEVAAEAVASAEVPQEAAEVVIEEEEAAEAVPEVVSALEPRSSSNPTRDSRAFSFSEAKTMLLSPRT